MTLHLGEPIELKLMGGHCAGAAVVYFPERRLLFSGDLVFNGRMPYMGVADFTRWLEALDILQSWDPEVVVPGHGAAGGKEILGRQREWLMGFIADVQGWAQQGLSIDDIFAEVLAKHTPPERWYSMIKHAIELALAQQTVIPI